MTAPLFPDGSNYPCKGYNTPSAYSSLNAVATLKAGSSFEVEFAAGGATHGGGSCQFSVSYDQGKSFAVIHSVIGGCPLESTYSVPIPSGLPSATKATFAWTWFNLVGNREEYMVRRCSPLDALLLIDSLEPDADLVALDPLLSSLALASSSSQNCAIVDIQGSSTAKSYTGPGLFRANTLGDTCITTEGKTPVFPNPGSSVAYGAGMSSSSPATVIDGCSYDEDTSVTVGPSGSSSSSSSSGGSGSGSGSSSSSSVTPSKASTTSRAAATTSKLAATTTTKAAATTSRAPTTSAAAEPTFASAAPVGAFGVSMLSAARARASSRAAAFSSVAQASAASRTAAAATTRATTTRAASTSAARTTSSAPPAATTSSSSSSTAGSTGGYVGTWLTCTSKTTFSLCSKQTGCTPMGSVAPGTECVNGGIVMASRTRMARVVKRAVAPAPVAPLERPSAHMSAKNRLRRAPAPAPSVHDKVARARAHVLRSSRGTGH